MKLSDKEMLWEVQRGQLESSGEEVGAVVVTKGSKSKLSGFQMGTVGEGCPSRDHTAQLLFLGNPLRLGGDSCAQPSHWESFLFLRSHSRPSRGLACSPDLLKGLPGGSSWMRGRGPLENNDFCGCGMPGTSC